MARLSSPKKASDIAELLAGVMFGGDTEVYGVSPLHQAESGDISFVWERASLKDIPSSKASVIVIPEGFPLLEGKTFIKVKDPRRALAKLLKDLFKREHPFKEGVSDLAFLDEGVILGKGVKVAPFSYVGRGSRIGSGTVVYPFVFIGENVEIGEDCLIYPMVSIREGVRIGNRVIIHSGAVIGSDGFGFIPGEQGAEKIPQVGIVVIEDDVEIGANVTIDRATMGETRIGRGTKIDNLVHIAHNVIIGENVLIAALCGIAGSSRIGKGVMMGGQSGVRDHVSIGDGSVVAGRSGITKDIPPKSFVSGFPAIDHREDLKVSALIRRLPELFDRVSELERRMKRGGAENNSEER